MIPCTCPTEETNKACALHGTFHLSRSDVNTMQRLVNLLQQLRTSRSVSSEKLHEMANMQMAAADLKLRLERLIPS